MDYWKECLRAASFLGLVFSVPKIRNWLLTKWNIFILCL